MIFIRININFILIYYHSDFIKNIIYFKIQDKNKNQYNIDIELIWN